MNDTKRSGSRCTPHCDPGSPERYRAVRSMAQTLPDCRNEMALESPELLTNVDEVVEAARRFAMCRLGFAGASKALGTEEPHFVLYFLPE